MESQDSCICPLGRLWLAPANWQQVPESYGVIVSIHIHTVLLRAPPVPSLLILYGSLYVKKGVTFLLEFPGPDCANSIFNFRILGTCP